MNAIHGAAAAAQDTFTAIQAKGAGYAISQQPELQTVLDVAQVSGLGCWAGFGRWQSWRELCNPTPCLLECNRSTLTMTVIAVLDAGLGLAV